jgi:thiosulfate/3-mercaptopyruvate sulfurtransferase
MIQDPALVAWLRREGFSGDDINARVANEMTPLMRAALKGDSGMARKILAASGELAARNGDGNNALWLACVERHLDMIDLLIGAGIDLDNLNDNGATALMYAASSGRTEVVAHLLARGADIALETLDGFSAMDMAANIDCLNLLRAAHKKARAERASA